MNGEDRLIRIYAGSEVSVISLNNNLAVKGIPAVIHHDSDNSFLQMESGVVDLYI